MKRFFKPIEKDGSFKKPNLSSSSSPSQSPSPSKKEEETDGSEKAAAEEVEPSKFLTWNANSLLLRVKNNWPEFSSFVRSLDPDVIAIQEVRMPAAGSKGAPKNPGEIKDDTNLSRGEKQTLMRALSSPPFEGYRVWWSLSDTKYGGTALLVKKHMQPLKVYFNLDRKGIEQLLEQ